MKEHRPKNLSFATNILAKKTFASILSLKQHKMSHLNEKKYCCKICQAKFAWKRSLDDHKKRRTGEWNCSKGFISHFQMMKHIRNRHTFEKLFNCNICGKSFESWNSLKTHKSVHSQQKLFQCRTCKTSFRQASNMKQHEGIHQERKTFPCNLCDKVLVYARSLVQHKENIHTKVICSICNKSILGKTISKVTNWFMAEAFEAQIWTKEWNQGRICFAIFQQFDLFVDKSSVQIEVQQLDEFSNKGAFECGCDSLWWLMHLYVCWMKCAAVRLMSAKDEQNCGSSSKFPWSWKGQLQMGQQQEYRILFIEIFCVLWHLSVPGWGKWEGQTVAMWVNKALLSQGHWTSPCQEHWVGFQVEQLLQTEAFY